jgi:hypothetical protein
LEDYHTAYLTSKFRLYNFPVREFLKFAHPEIKISQSHIDKATHFFNYIQHNIVFEFLSDKYYRILITIRETSAKKVQNKWIAQVWLADKIFD